MDHNNPPKLAGHIKKMYRACYRVCKRAHYPVWDDEYKSAINLAIAKTIAIYDKDKLTAEGQSVLPETLAARIAVHECWEVRKQHWKWRRQDQARARGEAHQDQPNTPLSLSDFQIAEFVAVHGRVKAAKLLLMTSTDLRELLDTIYDRVRGLV